MKIDKQQHQKVLEDVRGITEFIRDLDQELKGLLESVNSMRSTLQDLTSIDSSERQQPSLTVLPVIDEEPSLTPEKKPAKQAKPKQEKAVPTPTAIEEKIPVATEESDLFRKLLSEEKVAVLVELSNRLKLSLAKSLKKEAIIEALLGELLKDQEKFQKIFDAFSAEQAQPTPLPKTPKPPVKKVVKKKQPRQWTQRIFSSWPKYALIELGQQIGITHLYRIDKDALIAKMLAVGDEEIDLAFQTHWNEVKVLESSDSDTVFSKSDFEGFSTQEVSDVLTTMISKEKIAGKRKSSLVKMLLEQPTESILAGFDKVWPENGKNGSSSTKTEKAVETNESLKPLLQDIGPEDLINVGKELKIKTEKLSLDQLLDSILACPNQKITDALEFVFKDMGVTAT